MPRRSGALQWKSYLTLLASLTAFFLIGALTLLTLLVAVLTFLCSLAAVLLATLTLLRLLALLLTVLIALLALIVGVVAHSNSPAYTTDLSCRQRRTICVKIRWNSKARI
jgi:hypothetical protein